MRILKFKKLDYCYLFLFFTIILFSASLAFALGYDIFSLEVSAYRVQSIPAKATIREKRAERVYPIASITKLVTANLIYENHNLNEWVKVPRRASRQRGTRLGIKPGEKIRLRSMLYALLIASPNDVAYTLAVHNSGSEKKFVQSMNHWARKHGLRKSHFADSSGLNSANRSTAREIQRLLQITLQKKFLKEILLSPKKFIYSNVGNKYFLNATNRLSRYYDPGEIRIIGKTGYTSRSGYCFTGLVIQGGREVLYVSMLGADMAWHELTILINFGLGNI